MNDKLESPRKHTKLLPLLAKRFLLSKDSDQFLSYISWVSVVGVALGVLALVVVTSVVNGFESELIRAITGLNGDVILYSRGTPISNVEEIENKIRKVSPDGTNITHSFVSELMISGPSGVTGGILEGVDFATVGGVTEIPKRLKTGTLPDQDQDVVLGTALAQKIGAKVGDEVRLVIPFAEELQPKIQTARVSGISHLGMHEYDSKYLYAKLSFVQKFLDQPERVTTFKLKLKEGEDAQAVSQMLTDNFGYPFRAKFWGQLNKNLLYSIKLEKAVIAIVMTIIVIVAAFNVVSALMIMILDKTKEIAILKTMGLKNSRVFDLFLMIGLGIGVVGTGAGLLFGFVVTGILAKTQIIKLPPEIYHIGYLPVVIRATDIIAIVLFALFVCMAAALYPARQISKRAPLEGIRYD